MEPRIQYAKTSDGVNIAYWTLGSGLPLVQVSGVLGHTHREWEVGGEMVVFGGDGVSGGCSTKPQFVSTMAVGRGVAQLAEQRSPKP